MKQLFCLFLSVLLLLGETAMTVGAETGVPADVSRDGQITLEDASRLFYALSGQLTLTAAQTALADTDRNGTVDLSDVTGAFYYVNGETAALPVAVNFEAQYMDVSNNKSLYSEPQVFETQSAFWSFADQHDDVSYYSWLRTFKTPDKVMIAVPMNKVGYVAAVCTQDDVLTIATVTLSVYTPTHTAYAFLDVDASVIEGKEIRVIDYTDQSGRLKDPTQTIRFSSSYRGPKASCTLNEDGKTATLRIALEMSSLGYDITDMRYIATDDALIVIYDLLVPHRSHITFDALETLVGTMTIDAEDYTGQPIVLYEQTRETYEPIIGSSMPINTIYAESFSNAKPAENSAQVITSLEQLQQVYAEDSAYAPDYTESFTAEYFEEHSLILVKAYNNNLPESVTIDGLGISGKTVTVSILYSFREAIHPALYHGRILLEIDAADGEYIQTVHCQSHQETIV